MNYLSWISRFGKMNDIIFQKKLSRNNQNLESNDDLLFFWKTYQINANDLGNLQVPYEKFHSVILKFFYSWTVF